MLLGDAWRAHATLCADEYFASGAYRQQAGHYFPGEYALYVNGTLSEEESAVTLMHELLHAFCDDYDLATVVSHEEIEREAVILVHDHPALVGFVRGYLGW
ncbi:ImmA/IrrE family metallo-endopeptidase [Candidatus Woesearchaeota archaeon]|nr:MAG: ImmA/IrrE family metallo-endopeptidase [Candidatus Woesearchaeota archaeon]